MVQAGVDTVDSRSPARGVPEINATSSRNESLTERVSNVDAQVQDNVQVQAQAQASDSAEAVRKHGADCRSGQFRKVMGRWESEC